MKTKKDDFPISDLRSESENRKYTVLGSKFVTEKAVRRAVIESINVALRSTNEQYDKSFVLDEESLVITDIEREK